MVNNAFIKVGKAMEELGNLLREAKEKSRLLRILIWFDDLWFEIKNLPKRLKYWIEYRRSPKWLRIINKYKKQ